MKSFLLLFHRRNLLLILHKNIHLREKTLELLLRVHKLIDIHNIFLIRKAIDNFDEFAKGEYLFEYIFEEERDLFL